MGRKQRGERYEQEGCRNRYRWLGAQGHFYPLSFFFFFLSRTFFIRSLGEEWKQRFLVECVCVFKERELALAALPF